MSEVTEQTDGQYTPDDQLAERMRDRIAFQQLYDIAVNTCLQGYPVSQSQAPEDEHFQTQAELIAKLGSRGLCNALDIAAVPHMFNLRIPETTDEEETDIIATRPIRFPLDYISEPSQEMIGMVDAFGAQLLYEAYRCLGTDANDYLRQLQEATTAEEQIAVFEWLSNRVADIGDKSKIRTQEGEYFYHPIRLSPKVLGSYPNERFDPTCLGKSILIASFLHKAGWQHLHAGLMLTQTEDEITNLSGTVYQMSLSKTHDLHELLRDRLFDHAISLQNVFRDTGFHACCIAKLSSGKWYLMDPNFNTNHIIGSKAHIRTIDTAHTDIMGLRDITPAIERIVDIRDPSSLHWEATQAILNTEEIKFDDNDIRDLLQNSEAGEFMNNLRMLLYGTMDSLKDLETGEFMNNLRMLLYGTMDPDNPVESLYGCYDEFRQIEIILPTGQESTIFDDAFEKVWLKFLLWGQPLDTFLERCRTDEQYLLRRIQDVRNLPVLIFLECMQTYVLASQQIDDGVWHSILEVGLPTYRIGAAVLSDFAAYLDVGPSSSTWAGVWNSRIPLTEHGLNKFTEQSQSEQFTAHNGILWLIQQLRYAKQHGIIAEHIAPS